MIAGRRQSLGEQKQKRLGWLMIGGGLLWLVLAGRLIQVQTVQHQAYLTRAREQHERRVELKAQRGRISDRRGRSLAVDSQAVSFYANPSLVDQPAQAAKHFASLGHQSAELLEDKLRGDGHFVYLARQVDNAARPQAESRQFRGVFQHPETRRYYPQGRLAGQLLGYTNIDNKGSEGVEWAFEDLLCETNGTAFCKVNALGQPVPGSQKEREKPEDGLSVVLTIDVVFQDILEQELERAIQDSEAESGMGIISDPRTGEILAMANLPLYDPNDPGGAPAKWRRNRTITDLYEPGSTFKVVAAAAVLEEGLSTIDELFNCENGRLQLDNGEVIRDLQSYDLLNFSQILEKSSNIGTIKIARRLSRSSFYEYIRRFGFATRSGIELPGESAGLLQEVNQWSERSLETIAIGQEIGVTTLQLVQAFGAIANGGLLMAPKIVKGIRREDGQFKKRIRPQTIRRVVSSATAKTLREILTGVVASGTGRRAGIEGIAVAGKTGTAQQVARGGKGYDPDKNVVSFVGFLPAEDPELLCLVVVGNPQRDRWGGHIAAPAFKRIMERILYLPEGRKMALQRQVPEAVGIPEMAIPDLRGMTSRVARFQTGLRGLPVTFSGKGEVVVQQRPLPSENQEGLLHISCVLGSADDIEATAVSDIPLRQGRLLQMLKRGGEVWSSTKRL